MRFHALAGVLSVLVAAQAGAQPSASGARAVTETDFLSAVNPAHPAVVRWREAVGAARANAIATATLENPSLGLAYENPSGGGRQVDLYLSWQLPEPSRRLRLDAAQRSVEAAEASFSDDLLSLRSTLRRAYADWALAAARVNVLSLHRQRLGELAKREKVRAERGESSGLEARRLTLATTEAASRVALALASLAVARADARAWWPDLPAGAAPELPPLTPPPHAADDEHPRMLAAEATLAQRRLVRQLADRTVATPELVAGWQRQESGDESFTGPIFGLSWALPTFDRKRAQRALAQVRLEAAEASLEAVRRELTAQADGASATYRHLAAAVADAAKTEADNRSMVTATVAAFELGEVSVTDLLETLRAATEAELTALGLRAGALAAHRDLERLAGDVPNLYQETPTRGEMP